MTPPIRAVALIPARSGSKRIRNKNLLTIGRHPIIAYSIASAIESQLFERIIVSTDSENYATVALHYGAEVPFMRPSHFSQDESRDIEWVSHALQKLRESGQDFDVFSILRPTSPLRTASTIRRAFSDFFSHEACDSLRAVEPCSQHPGKMWRVSGNLLIPVLPVQPSGVDWFSSPTQTLPEVWVQNASLEIAYTRCVTEMHSISGHRIRAFKTEGFEGLDLNSERDLRDLRELVSLRPELLPNVTQQPFVGELPDLKTS